MEKHADTIDPAMRHWINDGLNAGLAPSVVALKLGAMVADVTAVYYADKHYLKALK